MRSGLYGADLSVKQFQSTYDSGLAWWLWAGAGTSAIKIEYILSFIQVKLTH